MGDSHCELALWGGLNRILRRRVSAFHGSPQGVSKKVPCGETAGQFPGSGGFTGFHCSDNLRMTACCRIADILIGVLELQLRKFLGNLLIAERAYRFGCKPACVLVFILENAEKAFKISFLTHSLDFSICHLTHLNGAISSKL